MIYPQAACKAPTRQLALNESVLRPTVSDEGQPRANESGPLTIPQPLKQGRRCDVSMQPRSRALHPTSTPVDQRRPTEPVPLRDCVLELIDMMIGPEATPNDLGTE